MDPTNKLVKDLVAMESCYVNTGHPDFLNGHRAMAIVNERHNAAKPTQVGPQDRQTSPTKCGATPLTIAFVGHEWRSGEWFLWQFLRE